MPSTSLESQGSAQSSSALMPSASSSLMALFFSSFDRVNLVWSNWSDRTPYTTSSHASCQHVSRPLQLSFYCSAKSLQSYMSWTCYCWSTIADVTWFAESCQQWTAFWHLISSPAQSSKPRTADLLDSRGFLRLAYFCNQSKWLSIRQAGLDFADSMEELCW